MLPIAWCLLPIALFAQVRSVSVDTNGAVVAPTNFFPANSNALNLIIVPAGNGLVKSGSTLHFGQSAAYTDGRIPFAIGTNGIGFSSALTWDNDNQIFKVGPAISFAAGDSSATITGPLSVGTVTFNANAKPLVVGPGKLVRTDSGTNLSAVVIGSGVAFDGTTLSATGSGGSVTSVGLTVPSWLSVSGSPVTTSGLLAVTAAGGQTSNLVLATPDGTTGAASLRALIAADLPSLDAAKIGSGTLDTNRFSALVKDLGALSAAAGDVYYYDGTHLRNLGAGTNGQALTMTNGLPVWMTRNDGSVGTNTYTTIVVQTNNVTVLKGGHITISNSITILTNGTFTLQNIPLPAVLVALTNGTVTNATLSGLTLSNDGTLTATGSGSGVTTDVTALGWSGTNITGLDCTTNGASFYLLVTNNCLLGSSTFSNLPAKTAYKTYTICFQQDGTGGYTVKLTNSVVGWEDGGTGGQPTIKTQANAVSYIYLHTDLTTNSTLVGTPNLNIQR